MTTDQQRIAEIRERAAKATPSPWKYVYVEEHRDHIVTADPTDNNSTVLFTTCYDFGKDEEAANLSFAAHAREDIPYLLARIEELERENERLRAVEAAAREVLSFTARRIYERYEPPCFDRLRDTLNAGSAAPAAPGLE